MGARYAVLLVLLVSAVGVATCDKALPVAPIGATITLSVNPARITADGEATITALVRRENGSPVNPGTEVNFSSSLGVLEPRTAATDERGIAETTLRGNDEVGTATITASSGAADSIGMVDVQIGSLAFEIFLEATPNSLSRDGGQIVLRATLTDDLGQLLNDVAVVFSRDIGTLASQGLPVLTNTPCPPGRRGRVRAAEEGVACDILQVSEEDITFLDDLFFEVEAAAASDSALFDTEEILISGLVSFISLQATPSTVPEAGGSIQLLALVQDDDGEPVEGAGVNFGTDVGSLASRGGLVPTNRQGEATDTLTVSQQDLSSVVTPTFLISVETIGFGGTVIFDTFNVRIERLRPTADFDFTKDGAALCPCTVTFTNLSTGQEPLTFEWTFGDGSPDSTERNPTHTYAAPGGSFPVTLVATNAVGTDSITKTVTVP